ncbi:MAG: FAD-dependent oxidoreductase [Opitutaceae bacterium]|nr:FAD-dependent oxidoreductase [Opitutaceae bacterium]
MNRRDAIRSGATLVAGLALGASARAAGGRRPKRVLVAGAGLAGLSCAFELMERGHDVTVLEASRRAGGHVKTIRDPLPDGLYADVGAENIPARPAYSIVWDYIDRFRLKPLVWPRHHNVHRKLGDRWVSEAEVFSDRSRLLGLGFAAREADYILQHGLSELPLLFFGKYLDQFRDEFRPLGLGLDDLDRLLPADLAAREGASDAAIRFARLGRRATPAKAAGAGAGDASALYRLWIMAIIRNRGLRQQPREVYHLAGGNQTLTDALASRLGARIRRHCPVRSIRHDATGVTVRCEEAGQAREFTADHLVLAMAPANIAALDVAPGWPAAKKTALESVPMGMQSRVLLQTRTPFWVGDIPSINLLTGDPRMGSVCETATEVPGERRLLFGSGQPVQTPEETIAAFRKFYPGKAPATIEQCIVHQWWKEEPTCIGCEREPWPPGRIARVWPHLIEPVGRVHFAGAGFDSLWRGLEAATRSAHRAAKLIDAA